MKKVLLLSALLMTALTSCYTNLNKQLDREVHVSIIVEPSAQIENNGNSNFTGAYTEDQLSQKYLEGLKYEFKNSKIVLDSENPEFTISIESFRIIESTEQETVNDTLSDNHGDVFELTSLDLSTSGSITQVATGEVDSWSALKDKEEKVKNNRSAGQLITGDNKDKTEYREKELDASEPSDLSYTIGTRAGVVIVKEIFKALN